VYTFEAAHHLPWHQGKCAGLHGHSYKLHVTVEGPLDQNGVVMDFADVDVAVDAAVKPYDHRLLNEVIDNPTCERVAADAFARLRAAGLPVTSVTLWETERGCATVRDE
jgi:6-pyruvoyltetrahydropterin/6-carboxytetrahydropterin synthase